MLVKIPLLAFLIFGVTYPLFFWLTAADPIKNNFHRFHLACPVVIAGLAIIGLWFLPVDQALKNVGGLWLLCALLTTAIFWKKETVNPWAMTVLCLWGLKFFAIVYGHMAAPDLTQILISILAGLIVSAIFYAMNLGHFYLNARGLKIGHLKNSVIAFGALVFLRLLWDVSYAATARLMYGGEQTTVWAFINSLDGFMLWAAVFFGTVFPLGALYFAFGTLRLKNTQATTGILYVILSAVLLGDLAYKYYLLKFGVVM
ncbi:MAG: hypothetical protein HY591_01950 [Candidatus Omnitrophica bacterium]|nr:hypothetical protein [Candidatus Omnitrophota bacterium]